MTVWVRWKLLWILAKKGKLFTLDMAQSIIVGCTPQMGKVGNMCGMGSATDSPFQVRILLHETGNGSAIIVKCKVLSPFN